MNKRKKALIYMIVLFVIFGAAVIFTNQKREKAVAVRTTTAEIGDISSYLSTTATIESKDKRQYYGIQAKVKGVSVAIGDHVKKGTVLVTFDTSDVENAVKQAKIQYNNAVLQRDDLYDQNRDIEKKIKELDSTISKLEASTSLEDKAKLETYKQQKAAMPSISSEKLKLADNAVDLAKLAYSSAKQRLADNNGIIRAEAEGVVTAVTVQQGTASSMMQPAVEVQNINNLKATVSLGKYDANKVRYGQQVIIKNGDKRYKGTVSNIGLVASKGITQAGSDAALNVEIDVLDKNTNLKIAFDVDVDILIGQKTKVLAVPAECIKPDKNNRNLVYIVSGNIVHEVPVKLGLRSDTLVEITDGLKAGEKLVLNPSASIAEGVKVKEE